MVSLPPHLQARPAARRESSPAERAIDDLLARKPAPRASAQASTAQHPRNIELTLARFRAHIADKSLEQLLANYGGRGSLLDLLV